MLQTDVAYKTIENSFYSVSHVGFQKPISSIHFYIFRYL